MNRQQIPDDRFIKIGTVRTRYWHLENNGEKVIIIFRKGTAAIFLNMSRKPVLDAPVEKPAQLKTGFETVPETELNLDK